MHALLLPPAPPCPYTNKTLMNMWEQDVQLWKVLCQCILEQGKGDDSSILIACTRHMLCTTDSITQCMVHMVKPTMHSTQLQRVWRETCLRRTARQVLAALPCRSRTGMSDAELVACSMLRRPILHIAKDVQLTWCKSDLQDELLQEYVMSATRGQPRLLLRLCVHKIQAVLQGMAPFHSAGDGALLVDKVQHKVLMVQQLALIVQVGPHGIHARAKSLLHLMDTIVTCTANMLDHLDMPHISPGMTCMSHLSPPPLCLIRQWTLQRHDLSMPDMPQHADIMSSCRKLARGWAAMCCTITRLMDSAAHLLYAKHLHLLSIACETEELHVIIRPYVMEHCNAHSSGTHPSPTCKELHSVHNTPVGPEAPLTVVCTWATRRWLSICLARLGSVNRDPAWMLTYCLTWLVVDQDMTSSCFPEIALCCRSVILAAAASARRDVSVLRMLVTVTNRLHQCTTSQEFISQTMGRIRHIAAVSETAGSFLHNMIVQMIAWDGQENDLVLFRTILTSMQDRPDDLPIDIQTQIHCILMAEVLQDARAQRAGAAIPTTILGLIPRCTAHAASISHCTAVVHNVFALEYTASLEWACDKALATWDTC